MIQNVDFAENVSEASEIIDYLSRKKGIFSNFSSTYCTIVEPKKGGELFDFCKEKKAIF